MWDAKRRRNLLIGLAGALVLAACDTRHDDMKTNNITAMPGLEFFNDVSAELEIVLDTPPARIANLANKRAVPGAKIKSLKLVAEVCPDEGEPRALTAEELHAPALRVPVVRMRGEAKIVVEHRAPNGEFFSVQDLLNAVEETERQTRERSEWFGGIDVHHLFFEGIHPANDGVWDILWGS